MSVNKSDETVDGMKDYHPTKNPRCSITTGKAEGFRKAQNDRMQAKG